MFEDVGGRTKSGQGTKGCAVSPAPLYSCSKMLNRTAVGSTRPLSGLQLRPGPTSVDARLKAVGDKVEIRPIMYLALSYDHRVVDCREAVTFRVRIKA